MTVNGLQREIGVIAKKAATINKVENTCAYGKLDFLEEVSDLYGVGFPTEHRNEIIVKAATASFLIAVARNRNSGQTCGVVDHGR